MPWTHTWIPFLGQILVAPFVYLRVFAYCYGNRFTTVYPPPPVLSIPLVMIVHWNWMLRKFINLTITVYIVVIECEKIDNLTDPNLRIAVLSRQVGGEIMFSCMQGFGLNGPTHSTCLPTGEWEQPFPTCAGLYHVNLHLPLSLIFVRHNDSKVIRGGFRYSVTSKANPCS